MRHKKTFLFIFSLIALGIACSTFGGSNADTPSSTGDNPDSQETISVPVFPTSIDITLEEDAAVSSTIGPDGGSISASDANGAKFILTIPEGALLYDEEITMTPIARAAGEGFEDSFIAGVDLQPDGLQFLEVVSIEFTDPAIEEGDFGFSTQTNGENFQPIPSTAAGSSVTITTTHFSDFGISEISLEESYEFQEFLSDAGQEAALTFGNQRQQLAALNHWTDRLLRDGSNGINLNNWEPWTGGIISLLLRTGQAIEDYSWDENTPGFTDLITKTQSLIDLWFQHTDGVIQEVVDKCIQGEVDYFMRGNLIIEVGKWLKNELSLEGREEQLEAWLTNIETCTKFTVIWQASIFTEGTREEFESDISLGAEKAFPEGGNPNPLEVEFIQGFWDNVCVPEDGSANLNVDFTYLPKNLGGNSDKLLETIIVYVKIVEPVYIDCSPSGFELSADAQEPFHGGALVRLNEDRVVSGGQFDGYWKFELKYDDPGGGVITQFMEGFDEESPLMLTFPDGKYTLRQLVTVFNPIPASEQD